MPHTPEGCGETLSALQNAIDRFDATSEAALQAVHLAVRDLVSDYHAIALCEETIDGNLRQKVAGLIDKAITILPADTDATILQEIRRQRQIVLTLPSEFLELLDFVDGNNDEWLDQFTDPKN